nr:hypothetical protein [Cytophagales bacterium]
MATLSILSQPSGFVSANNPIEYKIKASPAADVDAVFIIIVINGVGVTSWQQYVDFGSTDTYSFRVEQIVQDAISFDLPGTNSHGYQTAPNSMVSLSALVYGLKTTDGVPDYAATAIFTDTVDCLNTCFQSEQPIDLSPYILDNTPYKRFMTNGPLEKNISPGESEVLSLLTNQSYPYFLRIKGYYSNGGEEYMLQSLNNFNTEKRIDVGVGYSNLSGWNQNFLGDKVKYDVLLTYLTGNLFYGSDNGNFDGGLTDMQAGLGVGLSLSSGQVKSGTKSLKMTLPSDPDLRTAWDNYHTYQLYPNTDYWFKAYVYVEDIDILSWGLYLQLTGFTDAVIDTTTTDPSGRLFIKAFHNANRTDYFDQWLPLYIGFKTGNDTQGSLRMSYVGDVTGANVYVDEVSLSANITAAKATFNIVPTCKGATRVHFLNRLGAMDSYTFIGAERRNIRTASSTVEKIKPANYNPTARGTKVFQKDATIRLSCSSDALRPDEMLWLEELLTSPEVYVQRGNINVPVVLKDGEFEIVDPVKNIHRLRVELEYANDLILQQG